jgi:hypothetical protein
MNKAEARPIRNALHWFMKRIAFGGSKMFSGPANRSSPSRPRRGVMSGQSGNLEIHGQRLGKQIS